MPWASSVDIGGSCCSRATSIASEAANAGGSSHCWRWRWWPAHWCKLECHMPLGVPEKLGKGMRWRPIPRSHWNSPVPKENDTVNDKFGCFKWDILRLGMWSADKGVLLVYQLDRLTKIHTRLHHSLLLQVDKFRFPRSLEVFSPTGGNELNHCIPCLEIPCSGWEK